VSFNIFMLIKCIFVGHRKLLYLSKCTVLQQQKSSLLHYWAYVACCRVNFAFFYLSYWYAHRTVFGGFQEVLGFFTLAESNCVWAGDAGALTSCLCMFVRIHEPGLFQCKMMEPWVVFGRWTRHRRLAVWNHWTQPVTITVKHARVGSQEAP
jgi:hypothetical protein